MDIANLLIPAVTAIIVAVLAHVIPQLIQKWRSPEEEEKDRATAAGVISETSIRMVQRWEARVVELEKTVELQARQIEQLEARVKAQEGRITELEKENRSLHMENSTLSAEVEFFKDGTEKLKGQVVELGKIPVWSP